MRRKTGVPLAEERVDQARKALDEIAPKYHRAVADLENAEWSLWSARRDAQPLCKACGRKEHTGCLCPQ